MLNTSVLLLDWEYLAEAFSEYQGRYFAGFHIAMNMHQREFCQTSTDWQLI